MQTETANQPTQGTTITIKEEINQNALGNQE
jgi:hypothetical protein